MRVSAVRWRSLARRAGFPARGGRRAVRGGADGGLPVKRGWAARPPRPARVPGKPGDARLLHCVSTLRVPGPLAAGLSGRSLPPTPAFRGGHGGLGRCWR